MYDNNEVLIFDGTVQGLADQLDLLKATMQRSVAFVQNSNGQVLNKVRVSTQTMSDGCRVWDITLFHDGA